MRAASSVSPLELQIGRWPNAFCVIGWMRETKAAYR
jgi:hypothetical protein